MTLQDAVLLHLLKRRQSQTIGQIAAGLACLKRDAAKAVTILLNRNMLFEIGDQPLRDDDDSLRAPLYALTSAGELTARGIRSAARMMESTNDNHKA